MKSWLSKLKNDYIEQLSLATFSLVAGVLLADLLHAYMNYFILTLITIVSFFIIYYKNSQKINSIEKILTKYYGKYNGNIAYYDDPHAFYEAGEKYIQNAKREILVYNDYFGQETVSMGFNTPRSYYKKSEKIIEKLAANPSFKMITIIGANSIKGAKLSNEYKAHLEAVYLIVDENKVLERIKPFVFADIRSLYTSFTIIDGEILGLASVYWTQKMSRAVN